MRVSEAGRCRRKDREALCATGERWWTIRCPRSGRQRCASRNILSASRLSSKLVSPFPGEKQGLEVQMAKLFR
jgi:hypothetical protein